MGEPWVLSPKSESVCLHWPGLWGRGRRVVERLFCGLLGMTFCKSQEGLPDAKISMGSPLHSSLGMGDTHHDLCPIKNNLLPCSPKPRIIHRTNTIFPLSAKGQRHSWLIQRCLCKIHASFKAFWELAGTELKQGEHKQSRWAQGKKTEREHWREVRLVLQKGTLDREGVTCACLLCSPYPAGLQSFLTILVFLILPGPAQTSSHSENLAITQVHNELSFARLF